MKIFFSYPIWLVLIFSSVLLYASDEEDDFPEIENFGFLFEHEESIALQEAKQEEEEELNEYTQEAKPPTGNPKKAPKLVDIDGLKSKLNEMLKQSESSLGVDAVKPSDEERLTLLRSILWTRIELYNAFIDRIELLDLRIQHDLKMLELSALIIDIEEFTRRPQEHYMVLVPSHQGKPNWRAFFAEAFGLTKLTEESDRNVREEDHDVYASMIHILLELKVLGNKVIEQLEAFLSSYQPDLIICKSFEGSAIVKRLNNLALRLSDIDCHKEKNQYFIKNILSDKNQFLRLFFFLRNVQDWETLMRVCKGMSSTLDLVFHKLFIKGPMHSLILLHYFLPIECRHKMK